MLLNRKIKSFFKSDWQWALDQWKLEIKNNNKNYSKDLCPCNMVFRGYAKIHIDKYEKNVESTLA